MLAKMGLGKTNNPVLLRIEKQLSEDIEGYQTLKARYEFDAKLRRAEFKALTKQGFEPDQAMQILLARIKK